MNIEKKINILLNEMVTSDFLSDSKNAIKYYETEMKKIFPDFFYEANDNNILGKGNIVFNFSDVTKDEIKSNKMNIINSNSFMKFLMSFSNDKGKIEQEMDKFSIDDLRIATTIERAGLKYKKVSGKTPTEAVKKLVEWFKKNADLIKRIKLEGFDEPPFKAKRVTKKTTKKK